MDVLFIVLLWAIFLLFACLDASPVNQPARIQYGREFLLQWRRPYNVRYPVDQCPPHGNGVHNNTGPSTAQDRYPRKMRKRGKKGGVRVRLRKLRLNRIPLPSIVMANIQSLRNTIDELQATVRFQHAYKDACIMAFTESWLKSTTLITP